LLTLAILNILLIAVLSFLIYRIFLKTTDSIVAIFTTGTFLTIFGFSQYVGIGNYNFVTPYTHELTHGILLSFLSIYIILIYLRQRKDIWLGVIGMLLGLVFLTKPEVFLALSSAIAVGLIFIFLDSKGIPLRIFKSLGIILASFSLPFLGFAIFFSFHMPLDEVILSILSAYKFLFGAPLAHQAFYLRILGFDNPVGNLVLLFEFAGFYVLIILFFALLGILLKYLRTRIHRKRSPEAIIFFICTVLAFLFYFWIKKEIFLEILRPLPLLLLVLGLYLFSTLLQNRDDPQKKEKVLPLLILTVFAFILLSKIILNVHVYHYGFALAMPGTLLLTMVFVYQMPVLIGKLWGGTFLLRSLGCVLVSVAIIAHLGLSMNKYAEKTYAVGSGSDVILDYGVDRSYQRGAIINSALKKIKERLKTGETMLVMPEGLMLNFLSRRENPTPFITFDPFYLELFGEQRVLESLKRNQPDYIIVIDRDFSDFGYRYFGYDYGTNIFSWVKDNYKPVELIGMPPMSGKGFGILIARRMPNG